MHIYPPCTFRRRFTEGEALFCPAEPVFACTQTVIITQDHMDAGSLSGNVTIAAMTPEGNDIIASAPSTVSLDGASFLVLGRYHCCLQQIRPRMKVFERRGPRPMAVSSP